MPSDSSARLPELSWHADRLEQHLRGIWGQVVVDAVGETASTNTDLLNRVRADAGAARVPQVLLAESQTAGRGRMGRPWQSRSGDSLTFSIGWTLNPAHGWGALSVAVGLAVAQALQPWARGEPNSGQGRLLLKWPNDVWWFDEPPVSPAQRARGQKVAGILIETLPLPASWSAPSVGEAASAMGGGARWVVVGIGVNIADDAQWGEGLPDQGVAGTARWRPQDDAPAIWHLLVPAVCRAMVGFEQYGFDPIRPAVLERDLLMGQPVTMSAGPAPQGQCVGIDSDGALLVQSGQGLQRIVAGEVQVRPAAKVTDG